MVLRRNFPRLIMTGVSLLFIGLTSLYMNIPLRVDAAEIQEPLSPDLFQCPGAPFIVPSGNYVSANYHYCRGAAQCEHPELGYHQGIDLKQYESGVPVNTPGIVPVYAAYEGTVILVGQGPIFQALDIQHTNVGGQAIVYTYYAHMANSDRTESYIVVNDGQWVTQGQLIGYQGNYGALSVHLHFSVNYPGLNEYDNNQDPSPFLDFNVNGNAGAEPGYITTDRCYTSSQCCCTTNYSRSSSEFAVDWQWFILPGPAFVEASPLKREVVNPVVLSEELPAIENVGNVNILEVVPKKDVSLLYSTISMAHHINWPKVSSHYQILRDVFGLSGGKHISSSYIIQGTGGQTTGVQRRQSDHYVLQSGYWVSMEYKNQPDYILYLPSVTR